MVKGSSSPVRMEHQTASVDSGDGGSPSHEASCGGGASGGRLRVDLRSVLEGLPDPPAWMEKFQELRREMTENRAKSWNRSRDCSVPNSIQQRDEKEQEEEQEQEEARVVESGMRMSGACVADQMGFFSGEVVVGVILGEEAEDRM